MTNKKKVAEGLSRWEFHYTKLDFILSSSHLRLTSFTKCLDDFEFSWSIWNFAHARPWIHLSSQIKLLKLEIRLPHFSLDLLSSIALTQALEAGPYFFTRSFHNGIKGNCAYSNLNIIDSQHYPFQHLCILKRKKKNQMNWCK